MTTYYADIDATLATPLTDDQVDGLLDTLISHGAALSHRDTRLGVSMSIDAETIEDAWTAARDALASALTVDVERIESIQVQTERSHIAEIEQPLIPPLVGYAEIAEIAGVSRQRARQLDGSPGFPVPVVRTAAGPLRTRAAVESWAKRRTRKPGRPRKRQTADA